ncbi:protein SRC2-like protein [Senna tora]|uniref:Protein SRC2-like protein n=1 Tax=Senna tora TaxID=362788 RepID=A0A834SFX2_9FABA|nr:protein SRC2-like protein [Senna tora]
MLKLRKYWLLRDSFDRIRVQKSAMETEYSASSASMSMESIEFNILSCKDLRTFNFFQKLTLYALVYIDSNDPERRLDAQQRQEQRTRTDKDGNDAPEWNHELKFDLRWVSIQDLDHLFFRFEFRHDGVILGDKLIGEVRVPLKDLIQEEGGCALGGVVRFVNYEVSNGEGKANGIFYFSYRLIDTTPIRNSSGNLEGKLYPIVDSVLEDWNSLEIECRPCGCGSGYPAAISPSAPPPPISSSSPEYCYYYTPPSPHYPPPPLVPPYGFPGQYPLPHTAPPLSPGAYGPQYYGPIGPDAHGWPADPNFQHHWSRGW